MPTVISNSQILFGQLRLIFEKENNNPTQCHDIANETPITKYDKEVHGIITLSNISGEWSLVDGYARIKAMIAGGVSDDTIIEYKLV